MLCPVVKHFGSVAVKRKPAATFNDQNGTKKVALTGEREKLRKRVENPNKNRPLVI